MLWLTASLVIGAIIFHLSITFLAWFTEDSPMLKKMGTFRYFLITFSMSLTLYGSAFIGHIISKPWFSSEKGDACLSCFGNDKS